MQKEETIENEVLVNPITGERVDQKLNEKEARKLGYFDFQFLLKHLEDDNEYIKYFIVDGKKIIVNLDKPYLQYKKPTDINHERVLQEAEKKEKNNVIYNPLSNNVCDMDNSNECIACSG